MRRRVILSISFVACIVMDAFQDVKCVTDKMIAPMVVMSKGVSLMMVSCIV